LIVTVAPLAPAEYTTLAPVVITVSALVTTVLFKKAAQYIVPEVAAAVVKTAVSVMDFLVLVFVI
jgi:hypothetical protein